ncbi:MAG: response regulator transcription factor [Coriobacteriia bacterium]
MLAIDVGVKAYMCKECSTEDLVRAMRATESDSFHVSPCIAMHLRERSMPHTREMLTTREIEVLFALKDGLTTEEIGARLLLSPSTVKSHLGNIYRKFDARNRVEALHRATERGVLDES